MRSGENSFIYLGIENNDLCLFCTDVQGQPLLQLQVRSAMKCLSISLSMLPSENNLFSVLSCEVPGRKFDLACPQVDICSLRCGCGTCRKVTASSAWQRSPARTVQEGQGQAASSLTIPFNRLPETPGGTCAASPESVGSMPVTPTLEAACGHEAHPSAVMGAVMDRHADASSRRVWDSGFCWGSGYQLEGPKVLAMGSGQGEPTPASCSLAMPLHWGGQPLAGQFGSVLPLPAPTGLFPAYRRRISWTCIRIPMCRNPSCSCEPWRVPPPPLSLSPTPAGS